MAYRPKTFSGSEEFTLDNWKECVAERRPGGGGSFSTEQAEEVLVIVTEGSRVPAAISTILGYSYVDVQTDSMGDPYSARLVRRAPAQHPVLPYLYAKSIYVEPFAPQGVTQQAGGKAAKQRGVNSNIDPNSLLYYANYQKANITVRFWQPPYTIIDNQSPDWGDDALEWWRNTTMFDREPQFEMLQADGSPFLNWASTGPLGPPNTGLNRAFPTPIGTPIQKTNMVMTWFNVPEPWVIGDNYSAPKIDLCVGRVSLTDMFIGGPFGAGGAGIPAGTLLLNPPQFQRFQQPLITAEGEPAWAYNIKLAFQFFDPDPANAVYRGHNLMPFKTGGADGGPGWFAASRDQTDPASTAVQYRYLQSAEFDQIFEYAYA